MLVSTPTSNISDDLTMALKMSVMFVAKGNGFSIAPMILYASKSYAFYIFMTFNTLITISRGVFFYFCSMVLAFLFSPLSPALIKNKPAMRKTIPMIKAPMLSKIWALRIITIQEPNSITPTTNKSIPKINIPSRIILTTKIFI